MSGLTAGLLTSENLPLLTEDEQPLTRALKNHNYGIKPIIWNQDNWEGCDFLVFRNTWDYIHHYEEFLKFLDRLEFAKIPVLNNLQIIRENSDKSYLAKMQDQELPVVPTQFFKPAELRTAPLAKWVTEHKGEFVLKPSISADSYYTYRGSLDELLRKADALPLSRYGQWMLQPFMTEIIDEGEFSLVYFNGLPSHCVLKRVKPGDFRVQDTYGGTVVVHNASAEMWNVANKFLDFLDEVPTYARIDLIDWQQKLHLIELELIEPCLFLRTDPNAGKRFAEAIDQKMKRLFCN